MAEQKIRNAYKNFTFKFSPFLNANKNVGSIDVLDDKTVRDYDPPRFNFYGQMMESIVNSNPEIIKKVFNTVNLFKYKNDKIEKDIQDIKRRITDKNRGKIAHYLNKYIDNDADKFDEEKYNPLTHNSTDPTGVENRIKKYTEDILEKETPHINIHQSTVLPSGSKLAVSTAVESKPAESTLDITNSIVVDISKRKIILADVEDKLSKARTELYKGQDGENADSLFEAVLLRLAQLHKELEKDITSSIAQADPSRAPQLIIDNNDIAKSKSSIDSEIDVLKPFIEVIKNTKRKALQDFIKYVKEIITSETQTQTQTIIDYGSIHEILLNFIKYSEPFYLKYDLETFGDKCFMSMMVKQYYAIGDGASTVFQFADNINPVGITLNTVSLFQNDLKTRGVDVYKFNEETYKNIKYQNYILDALYSGIILVNSLLSPTSKKIHQGNIKDYHKDINNTIDIKLRKIKEQLYPSQQGGGASTPLEQAINKYYEDPELSPNIDKVNLRDRGIFVVLTFIIRAIALFITEWSIYSGFINTFSQSFNMYFGIYLCIFVLVLILTNSNNEDITFFNQLFFYINADSEDGKGVMRILLQITCIFFILPIPYMVKDFRMKDKTPNRVLTYTDKSNIYYSVDKFTLFTWILTSIVALSV